MPKGLLGVLLGLIFLFIFIVVILFVVGVIATNGYITPTLAIHYIKTFQQMMVMR